MPSQTITGPRTITFLNGQDGRVPHPSPFLVNNQPITVAWFHVTQACHHSWTISWTIHDKPPHRYPSPSVFPNDRELRASSLRHALTIDSCPIPHNSQTQPAVAPKPTTFPNDQKSPHVSNRAIAEPQGVVSPQSTKPITIAECRPRTIRSGEPQTVPKTPPGRSGMVSPPGR